MVDLSIFSSNIEWSCSQTLSYFSILVVKKSLIRLIQKIHLKKKKKFLERKRRNCGAIQSNISGNIKDL